MYRACTSGMIVGINDILEKYALNKQSYKIFINIISQHLKDGIMLHPGKHPRYNER